MKNMMVIFRTISWGGMEGHDIETNDFITEAAAREDARNNTWNSDYTLYKVEFMVDETTGKIKQVKTEIGNIECGRDILRNGVA